MSARASEVLAALMDGCDGVIEFRAILSDTDKRREFFGLHDVERMAAWVKAQRDRYNVYWAVATRKDTSSGKADNCLHLGGLYADIDFKDISETEARQRLAACPCRPSLVIASGGGLHVYWFLREPIPAADSIKPWLRRLAAYFGADLHCAEIARVLRIPGTLNQKFIPPRLVTVEAFEPDTRYNLSDLDEWLPADPQPVSAEKAPYVAPEQIRDGSRNDHLYKLARSLKAKGLNSIVVRATLHATNTAQCAPPLETAEVEQIVNHAFGQADRPEFTPKAEGATQNATESGRPVLVRLSTVQAEPIDWLWPSRLARGKATVIAGDPGIGKSQISLDAAARCSRGARWPDGGLAPVGDTIVLAVEDGIADTIRPRIDALGGDPSRIHILEGVSDSRGTVRMVNLARDLGALEQAIREIKPVLVIIDPITAYLGKTDSYKDAEVRGMLAPVLKVIAEHRLALAWVAHLSKDQQRAALHRPGGSVAFVAAARLAFVVARDPNDPERRVMAPLKANICKEAASLAFAIPEGVLVWSAEPLHGMDAATLLAPSDRDAGKTDDAEDFLRELLADGPVESNRVFSAARANGLAEITLKRAKQKLNVKATRAGFGPSGKWFWTLQASIDAHTVSPAPGMSPYGGDEPLCASIDAHRPSKEVLGKSIEAHEDGIDSAVGVPDPSQDWGVPNE